VFNLPDTITTGTGMDAFTVAFDYDASGKRIHMLRPDAELWHFGGIYEKEVRENDPDIAEEHRYSIFAQGQRVAQVSRARAPLSSEFVDSTTYFHYDRLGSVIALSDSAGTITSELDYDVYGEPKQPMPCAYGYEGHRHEQDLGLIDMGGRFYDPVFGVFLSADPVSPLGGSSPRMNRYAYVGYDPVNFVDPTGLFFQEAWNGIVWFHEQLVGNTITAPTNLLLTGRAWDTTWDTDTTEALITAVTATAAGIACGVATAGNPAAAGFCAGAVAGGLGSAFAGAKTLDQIAPAVIFGGVLGGFGGVAGLFANAAVYSTTASHVAGSLAAAGASSGMTVGFQLAQGGEVNWAQVAANAVVSGVQAWQEGAQLDAAAVEAEHAQAVGHAAGRSAQESSFVTSANAVQIEPEPDVVFDEGSERKIATLRPELQEAAREHLTSLRGAGVDARIQQGSRSVAQQDALFAQGHNGNPGPVVTHAAGGHSPHNYSAAYDLGIYEDGQYLKHSPLYSDVAPLAASGEVTWGGNIPSISWDVGHYELNDWRDLPGLELY
jgi:RHS repeat-associated protein